MTKSRALLTADLIARELEATKSLPIRAIMDELFVDPKMFDSYGRFRSAGFDLVDHAPYKILTGTHKRAKGYVFKKYDNDKPGEKQLRNYMHRVEGARLLRSFIAERGFLHVIAPRKWLYELPPSFPERYLVVAERIRLVSRLDTERAYAHIDKKQMHELATVLYYFRGLSSTPSNLPFTDDDQVAFIDTERWHHDKDFLRKVGDRLPRSRREQAEDLYDDLRRQGARPFVSAFK